MTEEQMNQLCLIDTFCIYSSFICSYMIYDNNDCKSYMFLTIYLNTS